MKLQIAGFVFCAAAAAGCTSLRLAGTVTDADTGDVVGTCGITSGPKYVKVDTAGHFQLNVRKSWKTATITCGGYESQTFPISEYQTRYPKLSVRVTPRKLANAHADPVKTVPLK